MARQSEAATASRVAAELTTFAGPRRAWTVRFAECLPRFAFYALLCYPAYGIWSSLVADELAPEAGRLAVGSVAAAIAALAWRFRYVRLAALLTSAAMLLSVLLAALPQTKATMFSGKYAGVQLGAGDFLDALRGARLVYGREGVPWFRVLTDRPFLNALNIAAIEDGAAEGIDLNLTHEQFRALSQHPAIEFWYGGYHFRLFTSASRDGSERFVLVLPPGPFENLGLMVSEDLYDEVTR